MVSCGVKNCKYYSNKKKEYFTDGVRGTCLITEMLSMDDKTSPWKNKCSKYVENGDYKTEW